MKIDVLVVGGSLAGAACARELARLGIEAMALEREPFPREKVCGGVLSPGAVAAVDRLGLLDGVRKAGAVEVASACVRIGGRELRFDLPRRGLGVSRRTLDAILGDHPAVRRGTVHGVKSEGGRFFTETDLGEVEARVLIDASGKLSRFTRRIPTAHFGVQFYEPARNPGVLDFWFFAEGYGGSVMVEGGRTNACFLVHKAAVARYSSRPECRVTGPLAYECRAPGYIAIGDAAGMVDPFCGEGMRHALETGMLAASVVAKGLRGACSYEWMRGRFESARSRQWSLKRRMMQLVRASLVRPAAAAALFGMRPRWFVEKFWGG